MLIFAPVSEQRAEPVIVPLFVRVFRQDHRSLEVGVEMVAHF